MSHYCYRFYSSQVCFTEKTTNTRKYKYRLYILEANSLMYELITSGSERGVDTLCGQSHYSPITLYTVFSTLFSVGGTLFSVFRTIFNVFRTIFNVVRTIFTVVRTVFTVVRTVFSVISTLFTVTSTHRSVISTLRSVTSTLFILSQ